MASQIQIAHLAKVSQSVVSRVLTGRAKDFKISDETIARVRGIADALNYQPNQAAHMLLGRRTKLVAVVVRSFEDPFLAAILEGLNLRAIESGYTLLVIGFEGGEFSARDIILLQGYRPEAFVVVGTTEFGRWDEGFLNSAKTIIQIGIPVADTRVITCGTDEKLAAHLLVEHLVGLGHRQIAVVGDCTRVSHARAAHLGHAMQEFGLTLGLSFTFLSAQASTAAGVDAGTRFLEDNDRTRAPTAVIATGDLIALSFIQTLAEGGIECPAFISVASYNDILAAALVRPALTTIRQPVRRLAAASMDIVTGNASRASILLPPTLKIRGTTAGPRKNSG